MEACAAVEREIDRVLSKFTSLHNHSQRTVEELSTSIESLRRELNEGKIWNEKTLFSTVCLSTSRSLFVNKLDLLSFQVMEARLGPAGAVFCVYDCYWILYL